MPAATRVLVIAGPTATGKTELGIRLAQELNGEIISGDSIQVYRGLDIGSAKASREEQMLAVHHLIDIKDPKENYSVKEFQELARAWIADIAKRGKLPIIVGGTGLYIKACLYDYHFFDEEEEDEQFEDLSNEELYEKLKELDEKALEKIHINNRKRLVRAINIARKHGKGISAIKDEQKHQPIYDICIIGLDDERDELYERISKRVDRMMEQGLLDEIRNLLDQGVLFSDQSMQGIGYKEFAAYFQNEKTVEECVEEVKRNTRHFVKRQYTWFINQLPAVWFIDRSAAYEYARKWMKG